MPRQSSSHEELVAKVLEHIGDGPLPTRVETARFLGVRNTRASDVLNDIRRSRGLKVRKPRSLVAQLRAQIEPREADLVSLVRNDDHGDWWSGRDLAEAVGYVDWRNFVNAAEKAFTSLKVSGENPRSHIEAIFVGPNSEGPDREDLRLTKNGALAVLQYCDLTKPKVAMAHRYFRYAVMALEESGSTQRHVQDDLPVTRQDALRQLIEALDREELERARAEEMHRIAQQQTRIAISAQAEVALIEAVAGELADSAARWEAFKNMEGWVSGTDVAHLFGSSRPDFYDFLREHGVFYKEGAQQGEGNAVRQEWRSRIRKFRDFRRDAQGNRLEQSDLAPYFSPRALDGIYSLIEMHGWGVVQGWGSGNSRRGRPRKGGDLPTRQEVMDRARIRSQKELENQALN